MANHRATGKKSKRGPELAQRIRAGILNALDCVEKDGMLISEILAEEFKANPMKFIDMASKYVPKDIELQVTEVVEDLSDAELVNIASGRSEGASEAAKGKKQSTSVH